MEWWKSLSTEKRSWFIVTGLSALFVVSVTVGIVACTSAALMTLMTVGFCTAFASAVALFTVAMVRLG